MKSTAALVLCLSMLALPVAAQAPVTFTTEQDHQNMMDQLGIQTLRPGPSGDENAPNHANTDEARANPYPDWPDILTLDNGKAVTTADQWWKQRRPQIVEAFEREVIGRVPANVPGVRWEAVASEQEYIAWKPVTATKLVGHVDSSAAPEIPVDIQAMLILPANAEKPVPVLVMFTWGAIRFPAPVQPSPDETARIDTALKAELAERDPSLAQVFADHPGYELVSPAPFPPPAGSGPEARIQQLVSDGWGRGVAEPDQLPGRQWRGPDPWHYRPDQQRPAAQAG